MRCFSGARPLVHQHMSLEGVPAWQDTSQYGRIKLTPSLYSITIVVNRHISIMHVAFYLILPSCDERATNGDT